GKVSLLFSAIWSVTAVSCGLLLLGSRRLALAPALGFIATFLAGWSLCGQHLSSLAPFLVNAWAVSSGYEQAMGWAPQTDVLLGALLTATCAVVSILARCGSAFSDRAAGRTPWPLRIVLAAWLLGLLFLSWKHGLLRADRFHPKYFFC